MVFVNDVGRLGGIPWWMRHAPRDADYMTFVDLVFPAFLFIVGMSIPLALHRRLESGRSLPGVVGHVLARTGGLLVIGVYMVNMPRFDAAAAGMSKSLWVFLVFVGVILVWNRYPRRRDAVRLLYGGFRLLGAVLLLWLATVYRGRESAGTTWMRTEWWGILGLIGWAYLTTCITYVAFRGQPAGLVAMVALFIAVRIGDTAGAFERLGAWLHVPHVVAVVKDYVWLGGHIGGHAAIAVAGATVTTLFLNRSPAETPRRRIAGIAAFAAALFAGGFLLRPLHHISKNDATPTWCLYSAGYCCLIYIVLYWLVEVRRLRRWAAVLRPAGTNPLLAYILPDMVSALLGLLGIEFLRTHLNHGATGIARSVVFALAIVALTGLLGRIGVRLRL